MKLLNLIAVFTMLLPMQSFAANFCRVDMVQQTTEIRVFAICDGKLVADEGAGRNNRGFGVFTKVMSDLMTTDPTLHIVSCNGNELTTCFLSK